jgi:hypothetical protein
MLIETMEITREKIDENMLLFPQNYHNDFDSFWHWKNENEVLGKSILENDIRKQTYVKLAKVLSSWKTYRNSKNNTPYATLQESLNNIVTSYEKIKNFDLTQFKDIPQNDLETLWHEFGRTKENEGRLNQRGRYNIIAVCKPMMLLWGQTMAFDSNVRYSISGMNIRIDQYRWTFDKWYDAMSTFSEFLIENEDIRLHIEVLSKQKYGEYQVPYGRFLDICYFVGQ